MMGFVIFLLVAILLVVVRVSLQLHELGEKMSVTDDKITQLQSDVTAEDTVIDSAVALINGFAAQLAAAVAAAQAAGATPAQLQSLTDLSTTIEAKTTALSQAVVANTPAATA